MNKKYHQLDNKAWVLEQRQAKSRRMVSQETGIPAGSIAYAERSFSEEVRQTFVAERVHKRKLESKVS